MTNERREVADAAHALSNACATLLGFAALAQESAGPESTINSYLREVLLAARSASAVAERLRTLADRMGTGDAA